MRRSFIPGTDIQIAQAGLGTMTFGSQLDQAEAARCLEMCLECGVNLVDTANVYNAARSETILGNVLGKRRERVVLASKVGLRFGGASDQAGLSRAAILRAFGETTTRLKTDYLDIYYLHAPDPEVPLAETLATMHELVSDGRVRAIGASNFASWQVMQAVAIAEANGWVPITVVQPMYNLIARRPDDEFLPMCQALNLVTIVYNPLGGGLLTGKQTIEGPIAGSRFDGNEAYLDRYWNAANFDAVRDLQAIASAANRTLIGLALSWLAHHRPVDAILLGVSTAEQLAENLRQLVLGPLTPATVKACDDVWKKLQGPSPRYNR